MPLTPLLNSRVFHLVFLVYSSLLIFLGRQETIGLPNFDEAFYAQKAKEMLASGSFWVVLYNGQPFFENTPLPFWTMALSFKLFGISGHSAVLPSALFGAATVALTYRFSEYLFEDRWTAFLAGIVLVLPGFFTDYARRGMVDVPLTFFVTAALFCFLKGGKNPNWYLLYGLFTAMAVLTKSVLGFFPLMIGPLFLALTRQYKEFSRAQFLAGALIALLLGSSWYIVNWLKFGATFAWKHFGWLLFQRARTGVDDWIPPATIKSDPFYFLGYLRDLAKNYWPWFPVAVIGVAAFCKKAFRERDGGHIFLLLWVAAVLGTMSASRLQALRYILALFPALAIIVAKTLGDWASASRREALLPLMIGAVMATALLVNATAVEVRRSVSLSQNSAAIRSLAPAVRLNTPPGETVGNYRLSVWNPRNAVYFYSDRYVSEPVRDADELMRLIGERPGSTWLTAVAEFEQLRSERPGQLYLIQADGDYAYFTSEKNRANVRRDFSRQSSVPLR